VDPREAVVIHRELRSRRSIAIHCCTFHLTLGARRPVRSGLLARIQPSPGRPFGPWTLGRALDPRCSHARPHPLPCPHPRRAEALDEPPALLVREAAAQGLAEDEFVCLQHGAAIVVRDP
jgi:hypothetical protein